MSADDTPIIEVSNLYKRYGSVTAVDGLSFCIFSGQIVGFIGANGAGKTTTMRMMATLELPDSGTVRIRNYDVVESPAEVRRMTGWMPDGYGQYDHMNVEDYLDFFARACGFRKKERLERLDDVMKFTDLTDLAARPVKALSKGEGQKLCFGRALLHDPPILILDEPAAGLDPKARIEFKNLIRILAERKRTIFISSHILSELSEMCDTIVFIDRGKIIHHGTSDDLRRGDRPCFDVYIETLDEVKRLNEWLSMNPGWEMFKENREGVHARFHGTEKSELSLQLRRMIQSGLNVVEFRLLERKLEDAFVNILKERRRQ